MTEVSSAGLTFDRWFPLLARAAPAPLVSADALSTIATFCARVPARDLGGIEVRLAEGPTPADFAFRLSRSVPIEPILEWVGPEYVRRFLRQWAAVDDPRMQFVVLEFDLEDADPTTVRHPVSIVKLRRRRDPSWLADEVMPALRGRPMSPGQRGLFLHCLGQLPAPGRPTYAFDLQCRGTEAVRLDFIHLRPDAMEELMTRLDRPDLAATIRAAGALVESAERLHFSFDVGEEIGDRLGVEASFPGWPGRDSRWRDLLDRLVAAGLCCPEKRDLALAWTGHDDPLSGDGAWPAGAVANSHLMRFVSHVKLACRVGRAPEAKIYLLFGHYLRQANGSLALRKV